MKILKVENDKVVIELDRHPIDAEFDGGVDAILISPKKSPFTKNVGLKGDLVFGDYWFIQISRALKEVKKDEDPQS